MRRLAILGALLLASTLAPSAPAHAQGCGPQNPNCVVPDRPVGDSTNAAANTRFVQQNAAGSVAGVASFAARVGTVVPVTGDYSFQASPGVAGINGTLGFNQLPSTTAGTVYGNLTGVPIGLAMPTCSLPAQALKWSTATGFVCGNFMVAAPVTTVFGRTGDILPQNNDYNFTQLQGNLALSQLPQIGANNIYGNIGPGPGAASLPLPSCSGAANALIWTTGGGFGCNTISAGVINSGTVGQIAWYDANGQEIAGNANITITGGDLRLGIPSQVIGALSLSNQTSGTVSLAPTGTGPLGNSVLTVPARTGVLATTTGGITGGNCASFDTNGNIVDAGNPCGGGGSGSGTVASGANGQFAYYGGLGTTTTVSGNPNFTIINGDVTVGSSGVGGTITFTGANSGGVKVQAIGTAGNNTLTLPARTGTIATTGATTASNQCAQFDVAGNLISSGSPCATGSGNGTVTSFSAGNAAPLFTTSVATPTTTPALSFSLPAQTPNSFYAGPASGVTSLAPNFRQMVSADVPPINLASSANGGVTGNLPATQVTGTLPASQVSGLGTASAVNTGTTLATVPLNNGGFTQSGTANFTGAIQVNSNAMTFPGNAAIIPQTIAAGTVGLGVTAIASASCATAVTGVATVGSAANIQATDIIQASFNGDPTGLVGYQPVTTGMLVIIPYPTAGAVNFKVCNTTSASVTPGAVTLNWRVTR